MNSFTEIISSFASRKILVVGDVILDQYVWGNADRISPEAPVPVVTVEDESYRLGGAANVVANICSLGGKVSVVSVVGGDADGDKVSGMLSDAGADISGVIRVDGRPTTAKTRVIAHQQHVVRIDREVKDYVEGDKRQKIIDHAKAAIPNVDAVLISDYDKGVISGSVLDEIIGLGRECNRPVVIDPKVRNFQNYQGATAATPNLKELSITGMPLDDDESVSRAGKSMLETLKLQALLVTRGKYGMTLLQSNSPSVTHIPAMERKVFDGTGAGDTVIAVFTLSLASGADFVRAARISNCAGGIVVGEIGTACVTQNELLAAIEQEYGKGE